MTSSGERNCPWAICCSRSSLLCGVKRMFIAAFFLSLLEPGYKRLSTAGLTADAFRASLLSAEATSALDCSIPVMQIDRIYDRPSYDQRQYKLRRLHL